MALYLALPDPKQRRAGLYSQVSGCGEPFDGVGVLPTKMVVRAALPSEPNDDSLNDERIDGFLVPPPLIR